MVPECPFLLMYFLCTKEPDYTESLERQSLELRQAEFCLKLGFTKNLVHVVGSTDARTRQLRIRVI